MPWGPQSCVASAHTGLQNAPAHYYLLLPLPRRWEGAVLPGSLELSGLMATSQSRQPSESKEIQIKMTIFNNKQKVSLNQTK